ncbi:MAG: ribonuclease P protein component [Muribaculaceae bacterium]|nr:ribonuclease P protein component [Muribaculaceae bacterium]
MTLGKQYKLCSDTAIDMLFRGINGSEASLCYPLRGVWRTDTQRRDGSTDIKMLISVPKRRIRHAVDRVRLRRRIREAFRLNFRDFQALQGRSIDLALIYIADSDVDYARIAKSLRRLLERISDTLNQPSSCEA